MAGGLARAMAVSASFAAIVLTTGSDKVRQSPTRSLLFFFLVARCVRAGQRAKDGGDLRGATKEGLSCDRATERERESDAFTSVASCVCRRRRFFFSWVLWHMRAMARDERMRGRMRVPMRRTRARGVSAFSVRVFFPFSLSAAARHCH